MKIAFLLKRPEDDHSSIVMAELFRYLRQHQVLVKTIIPQVEVLDLANINNDNDLYVLKPGMEMALSLAAVLHAKGARIINSYPASAAVQDKIYVTAQLMNHGIPTPRSFVSGRLQDVEKHLVDKALIVKPHRGSNGQGLEVFSPEEIPAKEYKGGCFSQEYLQSDGEDLKVYVIGQDVFAVKKKFPASSNSDFLGRSVQVDSHIRELALRIGTIFNLSIYGFDIVETKTGPYVVDVNFFPSFTGVPQAAKKIGGYLLNCLQKGNSHYIEQKLNLVEPTCRPCHNAP